MSHCNIENFETNIKQRFLAHVRSWKLILKIWVTKYKSFNLFLKMQNTFHFETKKGHKFLKNVKYIFELKEKEFLYQRLKLFYLLIQTINTFSNLNNLLSLNGSQNFKYQFAFRYPKLLSLPEHFQRRFFFHLHSNLKRWFSHTHMLYKFVLCYC